VGYGEGVSDRKFGASNYYIPVGSGVVGFSNRWRGFMARCYRSSGHSAVTLGKRDVIHSDVQIFVVLPQYPNFI
jgi:hypothetical protein